jgi:hypothetical protein
MIVVGTFIRGPGWMWFWPTQTWDHTRVDFDVNRNLNQVLPFSLFVPDNFWGRLIFGAIAIAIFFVVAGYLAHRLCMINDFAKRMYKRMTLLQVITLHTLLILMLSLPVKIIFRLLFRIKYILVTPWFSV